MSAWQVGEPRLVATTTREGVSRFHGRVHNPLHAHRNSPRSSRSVLELPSLPDQNRKQA